MQNRDGEDLTRLDLAKAKARIRSIALQPDVEFPLPSGGFRPLRY